LQEFPKNFVKNLRNNNKIELRLFGPHYRVKICKVVLKDENSNVLVLGEDWYNFFEINGVKEGDILRFKPRGLRNSDLIVIEKVSKEDAIFEDDVDFFMANYG
jgi:hypothetical protein